MTSKILALASALIKSRKYTMILVGAQFAYLGYRYFVKGKKQKKKG